MNWPRLNRALAAQAILDVEDARERYQDQQMKPTRAQWRAILRHDELVGAVPDEGAGT